MTTFSFSQVSTYQQCPRKYQYHYLDKLKSKEFETSYELLLGSLVHTSLEWRYQQIFPKEKTLFSLSVIPTAQALVSFFNHHREKETKKLMGTIRQSSTFTAEDIRRRGEQYLITYCDTHCSDHSPQVVAVETEKEMLFTLPNGQSFKGIIDRLDHLADGSLIINDYKTGKKLPTEKDIAYKNQLSLYAYALKQQYGAERTIKARLYYLHFNIEEVREIQSEYLNTLIQEYQTHTSEIEEKRQNYFQTKTPLPTQESTLCSYCEYQSSCPLRKRKYLDQLSISEQKIQPIIDTYAQISQNITKHKQQAEQNKKLILEYMEQQQCSHLEREQISLSIRTTNILSIPDKEQLETFLHKQHLRGQATSVTRYTIAALLKEKHIAEQAFAGSITNTPFTVLTVAKTSL